MTKKRSSKFLVVVMIILLCVTMVPQLSFADSPEGESYPTCNINLSFEGCTLEDSGITADIADDCLAEGKNEYDAENWTECEICYKIKNYFSEVINKHPIEKITINDNEYTLSETGTLATVNNEAYELSVEKWKEVLTIYIVPHAKPAGADLDYGSFCVGQIDITITLKGGDTPSYGKPTVDVAEPDSGTVQVGFVENTSEGSTYRVTPSPAEGYIFDYIDNDKGDRIESEDGAAVSLSVTSNDEKYTAHFKKETLRLLSGMTIAPDSNGAETGILWGISNFVTKPFSEGQRVKLQIPMMFNRSINRSEIKANLYAGEGTNGKLLSSYIYDNREGALTGKQAIRFIVNHMPDVQAVTAEIVVGEEHITRTYEVGDIVSSEKKDLTYLSAPEGGNEFVPYPTDATVSTPGPNYYDAAAFVNENTGDLSVYFAVNGGIIKYTQGGSRLVWSGGPWFSYNYNAYNSGYAMAVGGEDESSITAIIRDNTTATTDTVKYYLSTYNNDKWEKIEGSDFESCSFGLVMTKDDVWTSNQHWDGKKWSSSDHIFNSFYRISAKTAYAGSSDGIYKYAEGSWNKVDGTSGSMYVTSGIQKNNRTVLVTASAYSTEIRGTDGGAMQGASYQKVTISEEGVAEAVNIDTSGMSTLNDDTNKNIYVGISADETIYGITNGRKYFTGVSGYNGSNLYKYDGDRWIYQNVSAFDDPSETDNPAEKKRADGIRYILNPCSGVSLFLGQAGAAYIDYSGNPTITFNTNGGSEVASVSQKIGSAISAPASPTKKGFVFAGWYTDEKCEHAFTFSKMPAIDLNLYAKWIEEGSGTDELASAREVALKSLKSAYDNYNKGDYDDSGWTEITKAYNNGISNINSAKTYDAIQAALSFAGEAMASVKARGTIKVCVSVEKFTLGQGYIVEPTIVTIDNYTKASTVVTDLLRKNGRTWKNTGSIDNSFYLAQISDPNRGKANMPQYILNAIKSSGKNYTEVDGDDPDYLGEFDYYNMSGWMYCVNGTFPGVGSSAWPLKNGDVMRWQFTLYGYGADLDADNKEWGSASLKSLADKDKLTWKVAEINDAGMKEKYGKTYTDAVKVLTKLDSSQSEVDAALKALNDTKIEETPEVVVSGDIVATVKGGVADSVVSKNAIDKLISDVTANKGTTIELNIKNADKADKVTTELPKQSVADIASKTNATLSVNTPLGKVVLDRNVMNQIVKEAEGTTIQIVMEKQSLDTKLQETLGKDAALTNVTVLSNDKEIKDFGTAKLTLLLNIPSALKDKTLAAAYVSDADKLEKLSGKKVTIDGKDYFQIEVSHLSKFAIAEESAIDAAIKAQGDETEAEKNARITAGVKATTIKAKSALVKTKKGRKAVKVTWTKSKGYKVDGYKVYRATKKKGKYKAVRTAKTRYYINTAVEKGKRYFYKVRGYRTIDGKKVYTRYSNVVYRTVK